MCCHGTNFLQSHSCLITTPHPPSPHPLLCIYWSPAPLPLQLLLSPKEPRDQQLLVPLIVLMAQHLDWALFTRHTEHVKELAELYDRVNNTTLQVCEWGGGDSSACRAGREGGREGGCVCLGGGRHR